VVPDLLQRGQVKGVGSGALAEGDRQQLFHDEVVAQAGQDDDRAETSLTGRAGENCRTRGKGQRHAIVT
jgi:hypothetical protein